MAQQGVEMVQAATKDGDAQLTADFDWAEDLNELMGEFDGPFESLEMVEDDEGALYVRDRTTERDFVVRLSLLEETAEEVSNSAVSWRDARTVQQPASSNNTRTFMD